MFSRRTVLKLGALGIAAKPLTGQGTASAAGASAPLKSEVAFLSGTDKDHVVNWRFMLTSGRNSGKWSTVPVPSNWEPQGYGTYDYGNFVDDHPDQRRLLRPCRSCRMFVLMENAAEPVSSKDVKLIESTRFGERLGGRP
jgi:hypothetical protein